MEIRQDQFVVYHRSPWPHALIFNIFPDAFRISAGFDDTPAKVLARLPEEARYFLYHVDLTNSGAFPGGRAELTETLAARGIEVFNARVTDTSKPYIHQACLQAGIHCCRADREGDGDELVMVKTSANCAGASERKLTAEQRRQLGLDEPHDEISHTHLYKVYPRRAIPDEWWNDARLSFDRYINNRTNRMWRIAFLRDHLMLTEYASPGYCKKLDLIDYRLNSFGRRTPDGIVLDVRASEAPPGVISQFAAITRHLGMDFGSIDFVGDDDGKCYVIDVNTTPAGARIPPAGLVDHLRVGAGISVPSRRGFTSWLSGALK